MKNNFLQATTNFILAIICLTLMAYYLRHPPLSLPATAETGRPAQLKSSVMLPPANLSLPGPAQPLPAGAVESFVKQLHIHGIAYEQARQFGPAAVPILLELLTKPENAPHAANIVVTSGFIGDSSARQPLIDYLTKTQGQVSLDEFRGLMAVPYALGQLAHQGDQTALDFLRQAAEIDFWSGQTLPWSYQGQTYEAQLQQQSLLGLGVSGLPQALARLEEIRRRGQLSLQAGNDALQHALDLNQRVQQEGMAPVVTSDPNQPPPELKNLSGALAGDTNVNSHLHTFTAARHISQTNLISNSQLDAILNEATRVMQLANNSADVGCCVKLERNGSLGTFAVTDGVINTPTQLNAVLNVVSHQVKIVPVLDQCGGFNPSIVGCALIGSPTNMVVEYLNNLTLDGILWAHEFGHNQGLFHVNPPNMTRIMNAALSPISQHMTQAECSAWHSTFSNPGAILGACPLISMAKELEANSVVTSSARITYTITLKNETFQNITNVTLKDNIPPTTTYISGSAVANPALINLANFPTGTLPFDLNSNSTIQITYALQVGAANRKDLLINTAILSIPARTPLQVSHIAIVDPFKFHLPLILKSN